MRRGVVVHGRHAEIGRIYGLARLLLLLLLRIELQVWQERMGKVQILTRSTRSVVGIDGEVGVQEIRELVSLSLGLEL
jgi:hypothetical protein